jgi:hypothetical protein
MTPFELRAEMLKMAQDYLKTQYETNLEFSKQAFDQMVKAGQVTQAQFKDYVPKMYSFDEITAKAQELYSFVKEK